MKKLISIFLMVIILVGTVSCTKEEPDNGKINIVVTIFPIYDFARAIVGDMANLKMLISPGSSVHSFDPTPADIISIEKADIFIYIGGESDAWVDRILSSINILDKTIIKLIDCVDALMEEAVGDEADDHDDHDGHDDDYDEHIWTSPNNAVEMINVILFEILNIDEQNTEIYDKNTNNYLNLIYQVNGEISEIIKNAKRNKIVVADRFPFRYFTFQFNLEYEAAFNACADQADASTQTIKRLINAVKDEDIPYIYYVEASNKNTAKVVCEETGAEMLLLHSCHNISKNEFDKGVTYVDLMRQNAENLRKGLN